ncbi:MULTISPECIES: hypothetical protein [Marinobacter]|jgi:H+/Cl- antiporter ClcA|uniref:hypothetical protein n=1 Tax=Marinobacter TaxID=2742 RepID=UPI000C5DFC28|nr:MULTISPECIES: hypothetical protein [Marinobacter]MAO14485.1 hypothetical protein [Marinobacter sp.]BEH13142.1 hypothetical protein MAALD49_05100 [Marinobacter shengliensis]|tara:strand:+ start:1378 stop:1710 length:333 start_codon:yes stop_codon:yes gene_type:complete
MSDNTPHRLRKPLLIVEFSSLAILLVSMAWFGNQSTAETPVSAAWLLVPAVASLGVFLSFIGLMYLRWVASASDDRNSRHKLIFLLLALSLLGIWVYSIANTWLSLTATN